MSSREVVCFQWATNWIFKYYLEGNDHLCDLVVRVPGYRSGGPGFDSRVLQKKVGLERGPLSLVSTTEELLGRNTSGSGLETWEYGRRDSSRWPCGTLNPQKVGTNFDDKRRYSRYSSLADWGHGVFTSRLDFHQSLQAKALIFTFKMTMIISHQIVFYLTSLRSMFMTCAVEAITSHSINEPSSIYNSIRSWWHLSSLTVV
jgi:hypothetical protein